MPWIEPALMQHRRDQDSLGVHNKVNRVRKTLHKRSLDFIVDDWELVRIFRNSSQSGIQLRAKAQRQIAILILVPPNCGADMFLGIR